VTRERNFDHQFLDLRSADQADRLFLGGLKLAQRTRLFLLTGLLAIASFAAIMIVVDRRVDSALIAFTASERISGLVTVAETEIAAARGEEKKFLLKKNPSVAEAFSVHLGAAARALDQLTRMPESAAIRKHVFTIRDGLAQYDQQFSKLVQSEKALGLSDNSGLSRDLKEASEELQTRFSTAGFANLAGQVQRINRDGEETLASGSKKNVEEIEKRYRTLTVFLKETKIPDQQKAALQDLLKKHETSLLAMINSRFQFLEETQRFDDIVAYIRPSLDTLTKVVAAARGDTAGALKSGQQMVRIVIGAGGAVILIALIIVGLVMLTSVTSSIRTLAAVAGRLADGDRTVTIPGRGNSDAVGTLARALDKWLDNLADLDHLRHELDQTRLRLEKTLAEAESEAMAAAEAARRALLADDEEEEEEGMEPPAFIETRPNRYRGMPVEGEPASTSGGPISTISRQLTSFSQYVTAAANDVERTEALIRNLDDATRQIDEMSGLVTSIRDQTNLLAFRSGSKEPGFDNLVILSEDRKPAAGGSFPDADMAKRFDTIRDATDRAERTAHTVRNTMTEVTRIAREIAATASAQALEATSRLLSQSEYLQSMLDDVISKIKPAAPGELSVEKGDGAKDAKGKAVAKGKGDPSPKKD
jgi:methyl-accepting chemotaxis protein